MPVMSTVERTFCRSAPWNAFARRVVLPWALHGTQLSGEVLEIGGGSGAMAAQVGDLFPDARLTVTDLDEAMVREARGRLRTRDNVAVQADVTALPFEDNRFDVVTSYLMLHHVIGWEQALREAGRVLKPGGALIGYDLLDRRAARWIHRLDRSPYRLIGLDEWRPALARAGFGNCRLTPGFGGQVVRFRAVKQR
jgi:ubiquinone/menaquinone biosynthesis C-methylase UbiE